METLTLEDAEPEMETLQWSSGTPDAGPAGLSVYEPSFPARVAAFLRFAPIIETVRAARHKEWPPESYDIVTLTLAAIDLVVARQGLDLEATRADLVAALGDLARRAAPERPGDEHREVGTFVVDALLNHSGRGRPFEYVTSDYTAADGAHRRRRVPFSLLVEYDDAVRDENVLRATPDAINALIGGLDFDVEDEQVATELILERQLARNAFDAARTSAERARLLSVGLADELDRLIKQTRRDLRTVEDEWSSAVPGRLESARGHIRERLQMERRLLDKVGAALRSEDPQIFDAAVRIDRLLRECRRRHEELHRRVINARGVFLEEQERQSFRTPALVNRPDPHRQILLPALELGAGDAAELTARLVTDMCGPRVPRLPRLYRLVNELWARPVERRDPGEEAEDTAVGDPAPPPIPDRAVDVAVRAVRAVGLPARLAALLCTCETDAEEPDARLRRQGAEVLSLAVLWTYAPEEIDDHGAAADDLTHRILGPRVAVEADGARLALPGWDGDDLIVAPDNDTLAAIDANPPEGAE